MKQKYVNLLGFLISVAVSEGKSSLIDLIMHKTNVVNELAVKLDTPLISVIDLVRYRSLSFIALLLKRLTGNIH